jgi:hypothetical protein
LITFVSLPHYFDESYLMNFFRLHFYNWLQNWRIQCVLSTSVLLIVSYKKGGALAGNNRDIAHTWNMTATYCTHLEHDCHILHTLGTWLPHIAHTWNMTATYCTHLEHDCHILHTLGTWLPHIAHTWNMAATYSFNNNTCTSPLATRIYFW